MKSTLIATALTIAIAVVACSKQTETAAENAAPLASVAAATASPVSSADLSAKLCKVLNEIAPQAPQLAAIGTQAQLVMAIASAFDTNAAALRQVTSEIDIVAAASCPASRDALLKVLKMNSLQEAVR